MEPQGAFYCYPNFSGLLNRDIRGKKAATTMELADLILNEVQVAIVPGEAFGTPGFARFSFALGDDDLRDGVQRIIDLIS
jgi:aspartate/methionine/tyrosine aminotransferase